MGKVYLTGDTHADKFNLQYRLEKINLTEQDVLIIAGDVGFEYGTKVMGSFKKYCQSLPCQIIAMRGNHDNRYWEDHTETIETYNSYICKPSQGWLMNKYNDLLYQKKYDTIKYIKDEGGIYDIGQYRILFIPGAYSIDKEYRLRTGLPYNPREQLTHIEQNNILSLIDIYKEVDFVISHTAPLFLEPYFKDLFLNIVNQSSVDKNTERFLDEVYHTLGIGNFKHWFFGHFHDDRLIHNKFSMLYNNVVELGDYIERE